MTAKWPASCRIPLVGTVAPPCSSAALPPATMTQRPSRLWCLDNGRYICQCVFGKKWLYIAYENWAIFLTCCHVFQQGTKLLICIYPSKEAINYFWRNLKSKQGRCRCYVWISFWIRKVSRTNFYLIFNKTFIIMVWDSYFCGSFLSYSLGDLETNRKLNCPMSVLSLLT